MMTVSTPWMQKALPCLDTLFCRHTIRGSRGITHLSLSTLPPRGLLVSPQFNSLSRTHICRHALITPAFVGVDFARQASADERPTVTRMGHALEPNTADTTAADTFRTLSVALSCGFIPLRPFFSMDTKRIP